MRIKRWFVFLINLFIIGIGIVFVTPRTAYGAMLNPTNLTSYGSISNTGSDAQKVQQPKASQNINEQLQRINQAIQDNQLAITNTQNDIELVHSDILKLEQELTVLEDKMEKRGEILKDRAKSFQETGGNLSYFDVLLGSASISDFIDRAGTVATMVQADQDLFEQQKVEKEDYDFKHDSLENKLAKLTRLKTEYEGMQAQTLEQKKIYENLKTQTEAKTQEQTQINVNISTNRQLSPVQGQGWVANIVNISQKYIGHSVYVFGGGRTAADIQNGRFDCSGFVHWALSQVGINVGTSTDSIKNAGKQVSANNLQPGDLVFFDTYKQDGHVGIYIGNGRFIGSQCTTGVAIADMSSGYWKAKFNGRVVRL